MSNKLSLQKMKVRFSPQYVNQNNKKDLDSGLSMEMQTERLLDVVRSLSITVPVDKEKIELFTLFTSLGKVEHGSKGLEYINSILPENIDIITEQELVKHNISKIFGSDITISQIVDEYIQIYQNDNGNIPLEISTLKIALQVEKVAQGVTKTVLLNDESIDHTQVGASIKIDEIKKIKENYKKTNKLELTKKLSMLLPKIDNLYSNYELSYESKEELSKYIEDILSYIGTREELLDKVYAFYSGLNKKKIRGK